LREEGRKVRTEVGSQWKLRRVHQEVLSALGERFEDACPKKGEKRAVKKPPGKPAKIQKERLARGGSGEPSCEV